jgi:hypothetical protein
MRGDSDGRALKGQQWLSWEREGSVAVIPAQAGIQ